MICHNPYSNCSHARLYYYDFLSEQTRDSIPESTLDHIAQCVDCQSEIDRLEMMLAHPNQSSETEQGWKDSAVSTLLKLHFTYIGDPVQCNIVKPFLSSLADPVLRIRIPTPITRHIEKCQACSDALTSVRELHLTHTQLCRLGRLMADDPAESTVSCAQAQEAIPAVASMAFQQIDPEILKHVCLCPNCRRQLYLRREANRQKLLRSSKTPQDKSSCETICASDIYDCTFPYGLDPAGDRFVESRKAIIAHVQNCPTCLAKMQELHQTVSGIAERPDSGVVTVFHLDEPAQAQPIGGSVEITAAAPARIEENNVHEQGTRTIDFATMLKRIVSMPSTKRLLKSGLAAAVILIGLALMLNAPAAKAVTVESIYNAIEKVRSVYIANFTDSQKEPISERWVSDGLRIHLAKKGSLWVLSDIGSSVRRSKDSRTGLSEAVRLNEDDLAGVKEAMSRTLDFMPFQKRTDIPADARWDRVTDVAVQSEVPGTEVYDLTWTDSTSTSVIHYKWRAFVDPRTNLPLRSELYEKRSVESEYRLSAVRQIRYVTDAEIEAVIAGVSF